MIIIDEVNSEEKLMRHLERVRTAPEGWRCIHMHLSQIENDKRHIEVIEFAQKIEAIDSFAYFDRDGDAFLLGRNYALRNIRRASSETNTKLGVRVIDLLHDFYEVEVGWGKIANLLDEKIKIIQQEEAALQARKLQEQEEQKRQAILNAPVNAALINTISERRARHAKPNVMIVEDEVFSGHLVENALGAKNTLTLFTDGGSAIMNYARTAPHVLFLDIELPDISGHDVLKQIRTIDKEAYIVMLSGNADREHIMRAMQLGASGFVGKPFTREKLNQYIERCPTLKDKKAGTSP